MIQFSPQNSQLPHCLLSNLIEDHGIPLNKLESQLAYLHLHPYPFTTRQPRRKEYRESPALLGRNLYTQETSKGLWTRKVKDFDLHGEWHGLVINSLDPRQINDSYESIT